MKIVLVGNAGAIFYFFAFLREQMFAIKKERWYNVKVGQGKKWGNKNAKILYVHRPKDFFCHG